MFFLAPSPSSSITARDRKSTRLNSSHGYISYAVFCLKKKKKKNIQKSPIKPIPTHVPITISHTPTKPPRHTPTPLEHHQPPAPHTPTTHHTLHSMSYL